MKYCRKCGNIIEKDKLTNRDLCHKCYYEFLIDGIEHMENGTIPFKPYHREKTLCQKIKDFLFSFFNKYI